MPASSLAPGHTVIVAGPTGTHRVRLTAASPHGRGFLLVQLEGVKDRTAAEALIGGRLLVPAADLPAVGDGEFYWHELVGFRVETADGESLGTIAETFSTGTSDVWVVRGVREHLIPVIEDVVRTIDRRGRRVVITPLPGLLA
jgi:16S rRNA processing protein RimM